MLKPLKFDAGYLVGALRERGVSLWYDHERDKLCVWPPLVSGDEANDLRAHRPEVIAWLQIHVASLLPSEGSEMDNFRDFARRVNGRPATP